ncbi:hypothetical protein BHE90_015306 [Fusarium euwallaceae]|uniref:Uncharacterized protein n=2 Tax=Fusarium solani species complex TaxID=232080 RepID=A0A3M2RIA5_9HYPO|nr:hypothetical protein CDV36_014434 [Fusarium kuroshium]RTE70299.1 hypothetical protein BHE90_015306 [Fusarium euwallaceae]
MYPWKESLSRVTSWAEANKLEFDALGLVTFLGAEEVNASIGRLVQSSWVEFLPLLGAFVIASDRFTGKQPGFKMHNLTAGIVTTELAGWFSRWMKAQDFEQTRSIVTWEVQHRPSRVTQFWVPSLTVGLTLNCIMMVLTILTGDWFGLTSVLSMIVSVIVKYILVQQNCAGINSRISDAMAKRKPGFDQPSDAIVILDDSKAVTVKAPAYLMGGVFTRNPDIPNPRLYAFTRWVGWLAFAAHILSLGSAALHTQIITVVVIITATILTCYKFGCDDSKIWASLINSHTVEDGFSRTCWLGNLLGIGNSDTIAQLQEKFDRNNPNGTPAAPGDPADLNGDGVINVFEAGAQASKRSKEKRQTGSDIISQLQGAFNRDNPNGTPAAPGDPDDLNGDGVINFFEAGAQAS